MPTYVNTPKSITYKALEASGYALSSSQYKDLIMPNKNYKLVQELLSRPLTRQDLGREIGNDNYISKSPCAFMRAKALQEHSFLPEVSSESVIPMNPRAFNNMKLKKDDIIISKDSNIGEIVILEKDYPNVMLSGALYRLPINKLKYYLLAFIKHPMFRQQLDFLVPKGATIRHAKTVFLDCKIPMPNYDKQETVDYIELLVKSIIDKEILIRERHQQIFNLISAELEQNQKSNSFIYEYPRVSDIYNSGRLDSGLYNENFKKIDFLIKNYSNGYKNLIDRGFTTARGTSLENNYIKNRIDSKEYYEGFYELVLPTNISQYGYVEKSLYIGTPTKLKTVVQGDIIFGGEGFGKGRTYVVCEKTANVATNYHAIRIINNNKSLEESIFIRCFIAYLRNKGVIDYIGVGGSGGHCAPSYFHLINTPLFSVSKQKEISQLYHNPEISSSTQQCDETSFKKYDAVYNRQAGIYELANGVKRLKKALYESIDNIINDKKFERSFFF